MKLKHTIDEIKLIVEQIVRSPDPYVLIENRLMNDKIIKPYIGSELFICINEQEDCLFITVTNMYEYVNLTFGMLDVLSQKIGCKEISEISRNFIDGCETCDYGSKYTIELKCWNFINV